MMLRAIIIDDEPAGINALKLLIEKHTGQVKVVATTDSPRQGISLIEDYKPDIVFLDISMPDLDGFSLLENTQYKNFKLVFTTAHQEYAIKAIKHKAIDYLLKPVDVCELKACIHNIASELNSQLLHIKPHAPDIIGLSVKDGIIFIRPSDIVRLEASGSYTVFYMDHKLRQMASKSLKEYEAHLNPDVFYRCHNSHIINLKKITKFINNNGLFAQMNDGSVAEIAKKNKEHFLEKLKSLSEY